MLKSLFDNASSPEWLWLWESLEFVSIIIVLVGCWGEGWADHHIFSDAFESPAPLKPRKKLWERFFWRMVVIGLAVELFAFGFAYVASHREIEGLKKANLELEAKYPRTVSLEQQRAIVSMIDGIRDKPPVRIFLNESTRDAEAFGNQLEGVFVWAGFKFNGFVRGYQFRQQRGILVGEYGDATNPAVVTIVGSLKAAGFIAETNGGSGFYPNEIFVQIGDK